MSISVTTPGVGKFGFFLNATSANASGCEELKAAPSAGLSIYVDHLTISSDSAITVSIGESETTPGSPDTVLLGPVPFAVNQCIQWNFLNGGMKLTAAKSLVVDASGAGNINVFISGRVE
ncbi:MAG: hypothetical protein ABSB79_15805 [Syntrophales bacterium]|jgi:hypothetical protein